MAPEAALGGPTAVAYHGAPLLESRARQFALCYVPSDRDLVRAVLEMVRAGKVGLGLIAVTAALLPLAAHGGDVAAGKALSEKWCSSCHVVSDDGQAVATDVAPSFKSIADRSDTTEDGLKTYLAVPHKDAMKGLALPRLEIADLAAYIMSLRSP